LTTRQLFTWGFRLACLALVVYLMVFTKLHCQSVSHYRKAEQLFNDNKLRQAMIEYEAAITNYTPLANSQVKKSSLRLLEIGRKYEKTDSIYLAYRAYQTLTSSLAAIRSFYEPYKDLADKGRLELDRVMTVIDSLDRQRWQDYEADTTAPGKAKRPASKNRKQTK